MEHSRLLCQIGLVAILISCTFGFHLLKDEVQVPNYETGKIYSSSSFAILHSIIIASLVVIEPRADNTIPNFVELTRCRAIYLCNMQDFKHLYALHQFGLTLSNLVSDSCLSISVDSALGRPSTNESYSPSCAPCPDRF